MTTTNDHDTTTTNDPADLAAPLHALLVDGALSNVRRWSPGMAGLPMAMSLATRPTLVARRARALGTEPIAGIADHITPGRAATTAPSWSATPGSC
jgi:hypothetical protein